MKNVCTVTILLVLMVFQSSAFGQCQTKLKTDALLDDVNKALGCLNAELKKVQKQIAAKKLIKPMIKIHTGNVLQNSSRDGFRPIYAESLTLQLPHSTTMLIFFSAPDLWNEVAEKFTDIYIEMDNETEIARGSFSSATDGQRVPFFLSNVLKVAAGDHEFNVLWKPHGGKTFLGANGTTILALIPIQN